jgi:hypothetical protein
MASVAYPHIEFTREGVPYIAGTQTKVVEVVLDRLAYHWDAAEIHRQHPHPSLSIERSGCAGLLKWPQPCSSCWQHTSVVTLTTIGHFISSHIQRDQQRLHPPGYWWPVNCIDEKWRHPMFEAIAPFLLTRA